MRIAFSYENLLPISQADAEVFLNTAAALTRRGHAGTLLVPEPEELPVDYEKQVRAYYDIEGPLRIATLPAFRHQLALQHGFHALRVTKAQAFQEADLIYTRNLSVVTTALYAGQCVLFDHYRPWGDQFPPLQPLIRNLMTHPNFLGMVVHSAYSLEAYRRIGIPEERLRVVHNGFEPRRMEPRLSKREAREQLGLPLERSTVVYTGRINEKKGLEVVLELAQRLPKVVFVLVGSTGRGVIEERAESMENVRVVPWQSFKETAPYLYAADVLIIPPSQDPLRKSGNTVLPLKLYLYLAAGRAIFAGDNPDTAELLVNDQNACLVPSGDIAAASASLEALLSDKKRLETLSNAASELASTLSWDARAKRIDAFIQERWSEGRQRARAGTWQKSAWMRESASWLRSGLQDGVWIHRVHYDSGLREN